MKHLHTSVYAAISLASLVAALLQPESIDPAVARWVLGGSSQQAAPSSR